MLTKFVMLLFCAALINAMTLEQQKSRYLPVAEKFPHLISTSTEIPRPPIPDVLGNGLGQNPEMMEEGEDVHVVINPPVLGNGVGQNAKMIEEGEDVHVVINPPVLGNGVGQNAKMMEEDEFVPVGVDAPKPEALNIDVSTKLPVPLPTLALSDILRNGMGQNPKMIEDDGSMDVPFRGDDACCYFIPVSGQCPKTYSSIGAVSMPGRVAQVVCCRTCLKTYSSIRAAMAVPVDTSINIDIPTTVKPIL